VGTKEQWKSRLMVWQEFAKLPTRKGYAGSSPVSSAKHEVNSFMIVTLDTDRKQIIFNGKLIDVDPVFAFALAPTGTMIEVLCNENNLVTLKLTVPTE
jgi:hypothetical protein